MITQISSVIIIILFKKLTISISKVIYSFQGSNLKKFLSRLLATIEEKMVA